jgi:hypothetical protein
MAYREVTSGGPPARDARDRGVSAGRSAGRPPDSSAGALDRAHARGRPVAPVPVFTVTSCGSPLASFLPLLSGGTGPRRNLTEPARAGACYAVNPAVLSTATVQAGALELGDHVRDGPRIAGGPGGEHGGLAVWCPPPEMTAAGRGNSPAPGLREPGVAVPLPGILGSVVTGLPAAPGACFRYPAIRWSVRQDRNRVNTRP